MKRSIGGKENEHWKGSGIFIIYQKPHYERGSLFFVDTAVEMTEVGEAMAKDDADAVKRWMLSGDLVKIEGIHAFQWEDSKTQFEALVISPFVLCRPL